ncbi:sodium channel and clathrin linker 1 isoform X3 [Hyla sarda]|uniref:sodium channel and clathrin linker 1 isoform X3 n=1 Tax=Hyla sarda TaxID=327740 RepID=UPI0024C2D600|nr:sodium channel and clathrin linker 1 isoform X3 [Hyla sarda]
METAVDCRSSEMASVETEVLRDQVQKLRAKLKQYEEKDFSQHNILQTSGKLRNYETSSSTLVEKRNADFIIGEFDKYSEDMSNQLHLCQTEMAEMRLKLESIVKENETLHEQLKESLEKQLESLPTNAALASEASTEQELIRNLQEQLQLANQTNQQFLHTVSEQQMEIDQLQKQLRQAKLDVKVANMKAEEMATVVKTLEDQVKRKEEEVLAARGKEDTTDKRVQQLQTAVAQLETRLKAAMQDVEQLKGEKTRLEKHLGELQAKNSELKVEKYEAVSRVRDSLQIIEEANLQKDQALLREKQREEEIQTMKQAVAKIIQEAAARTRKEVESAKKLSNVKISQLTDDISVLQRECAEKQSLIERALRDKRAAEEELEKVYREGRGNERDYRKLEELQQRCLIAERTKDDLKISLSTVQKKMKQLELNSEEELSRCHETIQKLNEVLESERKESSSVSEERLKLMQENQQLRKDVEEWKKSATEAQQKVTFQLRTLANEFSVKEQGFKVQLQEMEDGCGKSIGELMKLLMAQQKASYKWKEETTNLTESTESRLRKLRSQLNDQKRHNQELVSQLETTHEKNVELENSIADLQQKSIRLQKRLDQAEERAVEASKQLSRIVSQRRKTTHELDLEKI